MHCLYSVCINCIFRYCGSKRCTVCILFVLIVSSDIVGVRDALFIFWLY